MSVKPVKATECPVSPALSEVENNYPELKVKINFTANSRPAWATYSKTPSQKKLSSFELLRWLNR